MSIQMAAYINSILFLAGIVLLLAGSLPSLKKRYPRLFLNGFMLSLLSLALMVIAAFMLS